MTTNRQTEQSAQRLASLPWTTELKRNQDGSVFARIVELPGCMTEGDSEVDALRNLREALEVWLESELDRGHPIPTPESKRFSGTFTVRTSPWLHRLATEAAQRENVSLNEFVNEAVALAAGGAAAFRVQPAPSVTRFEVRFQEWMRKSDRDVFIPYPRLRLWIDGDPAYIIHGLLLRLDADRLKSQLWPSRSKSSEDTLANALTRFIASAVEDGLRESSLPRHHTKKVQRVGIGQTGPGVPFAASLSAFREFARKSENRAPIQDDELLHTFELPAASRRERAHEA